MCGGGGGVQVKNHDGGRMVLALNEGHTVNDAIRWLTVHAGVPAGKTVQLYAGYPPRRVDNCSLTLGASGLLDEVVSVRLA